MMYTRVLQNQIYALNRSTIWFRGVAPRIFLLFITMAANAFIVEDNFCGFIFNHSVFTAQSEQACD